LLIKVWNGEVGTSNGIDKMNLKNRTELAKHFAELGFRKGAEVGVFQGYYSMVLLDNIPNLNLLCVDSWTSATGWGQRRNVAAYPVAKKNLSRYYHATILKGDSTNVAKLITDDTLDFVYIDADHSYEAVKADINAWVPKVKNGGIIAGHDYFTHRTLGVIEAVDEFAKELNLDVKTTEWDHENSVSDDKQPNWYFTKI